MRSEATAVQNPMLQYADEIGWEIVPPRDALALRGGRAGLFFSPILEVQLRRLNPDTVDGERAGEIIRRLRLLRPTIEGNRDALSWMRGEQSIFLPEENRERNIRLIDFDNPDNNVYQVTCEWPYHGPIHKSRADVVFLINGLPVAIAETKAAEKPNAISEGLDQIRRYHRETPELMLPPQLFEVTQLLDFYYGATWAVSKKNLYNWRDEVSGDYERKVKAFFDRDRFLRVLKEYILFLAKDDVLTKVILRQHQARAVEKVTDRVRDPHKRRGLIWHTQGSGKTLTMITIASRLLRTPEGEKPTVLMIVDRNELESQLFGNIASYGITTRVARSRRDLEELLRADHRGLIVSMIHKFDEIPADINTRSNIVVLVDEAHRTTGGDLGNYLMAALPNASYIGFTGTPIDRLSKGQGTFKVFGADDERGYLDKYTIAESIHDGTTVPLNYALAPSELRVDRETLEREFLSLSQAEGLSEVEELNVILDKAVELREMMKAPTRVEKIGAYVAEHYREVVEPMGFKAFLVGVDREACALYKRVLDRHLPPEYSEVVISSTPNDSELLKAHALDPAQEKEVRRSFLGKGRTPKILIVTEKLLTGFDAPNLYCMYLDKPMRDHVLLQAIARVNRPYEDEEGLTKPYGFVLDFVGIFEKLERALAFDSDLVASVIQNIDVLKALFERMIREEAPQYLPYAGGEDDKAKERAIGHFYPKERREEFYKWFRQLQTLYDILSPNAALRPYIEDYQALTTLYGLLRVAFSPRTVIDRELTQKTKELLRGRTILERIELPEKIHQLGPKELAALKRSDASETTKVLNLRKALAQAVDAEIEGKPFLASIGERAEGLAQAYEDRQFTTQQILLEFEKLADEYVGAEEERRRLDINENAFSVYVTLKPYREGLTPEDAEEVDRLFESYPDYHWDAEQARRLRTELYKTLRGKVAPEQLIEAANAVLRLHRL